MRRLKSPIVHPNAATHCSAGFYASAARLPPGPLLFSITVPHTPLLVINHAFYPRTLPTFPQTRPPAKTKLSRPPRLLSHSLHPRSRPLFPLWPHCPLDSGISPPNCHPAILLPSCLLPDAGSLACTGAWQFPVCKSLVLCQNLQTQNHIPFPLQNRKNTLANFLF